MKVFFRRIHLYLGLASGLFLVMVCLTGSILVFEQELEHLWHPARYYVAPAGGPRLSLAQLTAAVRAAKPKAQLSSFKLYADPTRTVEVSLAGGGPKGGGKGEGSGEGGGRNAAQRGEGRGATAGEGPRGGQGRGEGRAESRGAMAGSAEARGPGGPAGKGGPGGKGGKGGPRLFLNPYTGAIVGELKPQDSFFHFIEQLHRGLVAGRVGKLIMGINGIIFLFILGTGIVLWWPAARKALTARLTVKWGSSWKRLNHDFHIVLGFYTSVFLFIMALTGVGMSFDWVGKTINTVTHSPQQRPEPPTSTVPAEKGPAFGADAALAAARQQAPGALTYAVQLPKEPTGSLQVSSLRPGALTERATDDVYFDRYSGQVLRQTTYAQQPLGQRIRGLFKPVHTGAIFGWPTKVLAFVIVLLGATFPISGTILWLNRTRKSKKKSAPRGLAVEVG
ncbi:PepSY-associated TM helix domain-containing protein [Hymenobacter nivis]|nr:PepSY-associated TM helix domain-containing protein [Hymenobacter nivis]